MRRWRDEPSRPTVAEFEAAVAGWFPGMTDGQVDAVVEAVRAAFAAPGRGG